MSVFGSLFTAVSGLNSQGQSIAMISNNIANVSTVGYKRTDAAFSSLVTSPGRSTQYSPGAVSAVQNARIDQQGILQQTGSPTDIALSGAGFFVVKPSASDPLAEPLYTRAGSFTEDATGVLRNASGFYLQGWPLDQNGGLPASQSNLESLVPVNIAFLGGLTNPTSEASMGLNLDAAETQAVYPLAPGAAGNFSRGIRVFDSQGEGHDLTVSFKKITSPTASALGNVDLSGIDGNLADVVPPTFFVTDAFDIQVGALAPTNIVLNGTVSDLLADINAIVDPATLEPVVYATLDDNGFLSIKARNPGPGQDIVLTDTVGSPLSFGELGLGASPLTYLAPVAPTILGGATLLDTPNTDGWWTVDFISDAPGNPILLTGEINFTSIGQLNIAEDVNDQVLIPLSAIDWGNDTQLQDIDFDIAGLTQFSGAYNVISSTQNGSALGLRTGASIDSEGYVNVQFSNGQSTRIYKLAVATFPNTNGMTELTGNVWRESDVSGLVILREAGTGTAGQIAGGALEASNVDLAEEFSKMIVTQRAYSANTKVINTADQMTQELLQLR